MKNDSTIVVRVPTELKASLVQIAQRLGVSLADVTRAILIAARDNGATITVAMQPKTGDKNV